MVASVNLREEVFCKKGKIALFEIPLIFTERVYHVYNSA